MLGIHTGAATKSNSDESVLHRGGDAYRYLLGAAIVASLVISFGGIWSIPFLSHNEGRRGTVVQEMLRNHEWLIPTLNGKIYITKPPLFYWVAGLFSILFHSTAEWVMRLPSSLGALGVVWLTFQRVRRYIGEWLALFAVAILLSSVAFNMFARRVEIEMLITFCSTASMLTFFDFLMNPEERRSLYLSYFFLGLAFLTKGPVALVFFIPPLVIFYAIQRDRNVLAGLLSGWGWLIFACVALPWYLYSLIHLKSSLMGSVVEKDITGKIFGSAKRDSFFEDFIAIAANFIPWIAVVLFSARHFLRTLLYKYETGFFFCWFIAPLIIMSCFGEKHIKYLLPLFPALAVFLGSWLANIYFDLSGEGKIRGYIPRVCAVLLALCCITTLLSNLVFTATGLAPFLPWCSKSMKFSRTPLRILTHTSTLRLCTIWEDQYRKWIRRCWIAC